MRHFLKFRPLALAVAGLMLGLSALIPTTGVAAQFFPTNGLGVQAFPPNAVISTYVDARFCGNGLVSVVTDGGGNLINVCTSTGQRIIPPFTQGYNPYLWYGSNIGQQQIIPSTWIASPSYWNGWNGQQQGFPTFWNGNPYQFPGSSNTYTYNFGFNRGYGGGAQYTYTDTRTNCPNGSVTATSSGYFCAANGAPAFVVR